MNETEWKDMEDFTVSVLKQSQFMLSAILHRAKEMKGELGTEYDFITELHLFRSLFEMYLKIMEGLIQENIRNEVGL